MFNWIGLHERLSVIVSGRRGSATRSSTCDSPFQRHAELPPQVDNVAGAIFGDILLSLTDTESEENSNNNLMMR